MEVERPERTKKRKKLSDHSLKYIGKHSVDQSQQSVGLDSISAQFIWSPRLCAEKIGEFSMMSF